MTTRLIGGRDVSGRRKDSATMVDALSRQEGTTMPGTLARVWLVRLLVTVVIFGSLSSLPALDQVKTLGQESPIPASTPLTGGVLAAWTQIGTDDALHLRAVTARGCPEAIIDGSAFSMSVRAVPTEAFPVTVCEARVPNDAGAIEVSGVALQGRSADPSRVLVLGDSGCRINESVQQACADPNAWPLARIADQGAVWRPELVIHLGDYLYREMACPEGVAGCAGSPWGDTWAAW
ncbi:MAG: hypothetical protein AB7V46_03385, partial [Thermomicrobiales bacterium]